MMGPPGDAVGPAEGQSTWEFQSRRVLCLVWATGLVLWGTRSSSWELSSGGDVTLRLDPGGGWSDHGLQA